ncbi:MAG: TspO/MBR family protein [Candidatus Peregrinibacteria bacterium]|nr:TspO/MBR family protein [Candidatus Peregrinibacteria bacterium]MDZ4244921.1 TspO/MBR family protein [Candidatus Gracilibacteria bacterium]
METQTWYEMLIRPSFAPPSWVFGPVWSVLYLVIAITFGYVFFLYFKRKISFSVVLPFILNLVFNFSFMPIQFGLQNNLLAAVDILLVLGTLILAGVKIFPHAKWVVYANIPYLLWVSFATILQLTITYLNW